MIVRVFDYCFGIVRSISITQNVLCTSLQGCENGSVGQLPKNSDDTLPTYSTIAEYGPAHLGFCSA